MSLFYHVMAPVAAAAICIAAIRLWRWRPALWSLVMRSRPRRWTPRGFRASDWGVDQALGPDETAVHMVLSAGGQITPASLVYVRPVDGPTPDHAAELVARVADGPGADLSPLVIPLTASQALRMGLDLIHEHARQCGRRQMKLPGVPDRQPGRGGVTG
ncbi:hypothetical protein [Pyruvatibacter mobilis]|uniref:hypothetical protein n=1 Tax=Pyruvatibacter mobilis TaxID=1712261 RepID=UPI003BABA05A